MNRPILFDSPFLLGFEHTRSLIERAARTAASRPIRRIASFARPRASTA